MNLGANIFKMIRIESLQSMAEAVYSSLDNFRIGVVKMALLILKHKDIYYEQSRTY